MKNPSSLTAKSPKDVCISVVTAISQGARDYQEDAWGHWSDAAGTWLFAVVADGAGGHGGGSDASRAAISYSAKIWEKCVVNDLADPAAFLAKWMENAHRAVNEESARIHRSARAVVVACLTDGRTAHWVHAGDSRLLRFHEGKLVERTRDDSVVQVLFERGDITEEEMGTHPDQSRLLQSLGGDEAPSPRPGNAEMMAGDVLILCSDGFWEYLKPVELEKLSATAPGKRQQALNHAVADAVRRAGSKADNTTAVMIAFDGTESAVSCSGIHWALLLLAALVVGAAVGWWLGGRTDHLAFPDTHWRWSGDKAESRLAPEVPSPAPANKQENPVKPPETQQISKWPGKVPKTQPQPQKTPQ